MRPDGDRFQRRLILEGCNQEEFEKFFRQGGAFGLGLAFVKRLYQFCAPCRQFAQEP